MIYIKYKLEIKKLTREDISAFDIQIIKIKKHQHNL